MGFSFRQDSDRGGALFHDGEQLCTIDDLGLGELRFRRGGPPLVGAAVRIPLYWRQYARHQDPDRRLDARASLAVLPAGDGEFLLRAEGRHPSMDLRSACRLRVRARDGRYLYDVDTALAAAGAARWTVTPEPDHGELEFCAIWPADCFRTDGGATRYDACHALRGGTAERIPHHHFPTPEKRDIALRAGDRLLWSAGEENLQFELLEAQAAGAQAAGAPAAVSAGICAYMWDAHIGCRCCAGEQRALRAGFHASARYRLSSPDREACMRALRDERPASLEPLRGAPALLDGRAVALRPEGLTEEALRALWPWEFSGTMDAARAVEDDEGGGARFRIALAGGGRGEWRYTCVGEAYGEAPATAGERFTISARVRVRGGAAAALGLRYHQEEVGDVFDPDSYRCDVSPPLAGAAEEWTPMELRVGPLAPRPDRLHLLLVLDGAGEAEWRDVRFTRGGAA